MDPFLFKKFFFYLVPNVKNFREQYLIWCFLDPRRDTPYFSSVSTEKKVLGYVDDFTNQYEKCLV